MAGTASGRSTTASMLLKMAVFAPIPIAIVSTAVMEKPGDFRNRRTAYRTSAHRRSSPRVASAAITRSRVAVRFPKRTSASRCASSGDMPRAMFSSMRIPRDASSSASISRSTALRRKKLPILRKMAIAFLSRVAQYGAHALYQLIEALFGLLQLLTPTRRERVVLGATIRFGHRPLRIDPSPLLHAVQSGIQRSLLHTQQFTRCVLDVQHDAVAVQGSILCKSFQNQEIERSLEVSLGHRRLPGSLDTKNTRHSILGVSRRCFRLDKKANPWLPQPTLISHLVDLPEPFSS